MTDGELIGKRFNRLIVPWLATSALYIAAAVRSGQFRTSMIWTGGSTHLWFLPFIFVVGCTAGLLARRGLIQRSLTSTIGWSIAAIVAMAIEPYVSLLLPGVEPLWQVVNALPSALLGIALFAVPDRSGIAPLLGAIAGAGAAIWLTIPSAVHPRAWPAAAACGAVMFGIARLLPIPSTRASAFVGRTSFGVYLLHILMLSLVVRAWSKLASGSVDHVPSDTATPIILAQVAICIAICILIVAILERTPLRRFIGRFDAPLAVTIPLF